MIRFGEAPFLECSSRGEKRLSALYAVIPWRNNRTIESLYQGYKLFPGRVQGLSFQEAKGKAPLNINAAREYYSLLWDEYFEIHPELFELTRPYNGFSDMFGQAGHACQAEEIHRIVMNHRKNEKP